MSNIKCHYPLTLHWGGRPYKDKKKVINIPSETNLVNGVLKTRKKGVFLSNKNKNRDFVLINENFSSSKAVIEIPEKTSQLDARLCDKNQIERTIEDALNGDSPCRRSDSLECVLEADLANDLGDIMKAYCRDEDAKYLRGDVAVFEGACDQNGVVQFETQGGIELEATKTQYVTPRLTRSIQNSTPAFDFLKSSTEYRNLFEFYMNKTSHLFVVLSCEGHKSNPFRTILPRMAMYSTTLMKLLLAFSGQHRKQLRLAAEGSSFKPLEEDLSRLDSENLSQELVEQSMTELIEKLGNDHERLSDLTLANILMFAHYSLYICDRRSRWRTHFYGAKGIFMSKLAKHSNGQDRVIYLTNEQGSYIFLQRWFAYMNFMGVLSSPNLTSKSQFGSDLKFDFTSVRKRQSLEALRKDFDDIEYPTGMEVEVLSLLAKVSYLVVEKEKEERSIFNPKLIADAIDLDYEILEHLESSEKERDSIWMERQQEHLELLSDRRIKNYFLLRTTNLIYGLTGVLQLRRRVIGMPQDSKLVRKLLLRVTNLIDKKIPLNSPGLSCIIFCLFSCGCELIDHSLVLLRDVYLDRLNLLEESGVGCAAQAKAVMKECWKTKKFWWDVINEKDLDISFAL